MNFGMAHGFKSFISALSGSIQSPREDVSFDLAVPLISHKFLEPLSKTRQFLERKLGNGEFQFFNAHNQKLHI